MARLIKLLLACAFVLPSCVAPKAWVMGRYGEWDLEGDFAAVDTSGPGTLDVRTSTEDLGLTEKDDSFSGRVDVKWAGGRVTASNLTAMFQGSGMVTTDITLDGNTITTGTAVDSTMDFDVLSSTITWDVFPGKMVDIGLGFGGGVLDLFAEIDDTMGTVLTTDEEAPFIMPAAYVSADVGPVLVTLLGSYIDTDWLSLDDDDVDAAIFDIDLNASYKVIGGNDRLRGFLTVGWRQLNIDAEYEDGTSSVATDVDLSGLYFGFTGTL